MFLPTAFERYKGTVPQGKFALGSDSVSSPRGDSLYVYKMADQQPRRLMIGYSAPSGSVPVYADTYVLDWQTKLWYRFGLQKTLVPGTILNSDLIGSFNELPGTILTDQGEGTYVALVVSDNANAPNGKHVFSLGSDLDLEVAGPWVAVAEAVGVVEEFVDAEWEVAVGSEGGERFACEGLVLVVGFGR